MKGLFQCPPRATPWVMMNTSLSPCKGKSFLFLREKVFFEKKVSKSHFLLKILT